MLTKDKYNLYSDDIDVDENNNDKGYYSIIDELKNNNLPDHIKLKYALSIAEQLNIKVKDISYKYNYVNEKFKELSDIVFSREEEKIYNLKTFILKNV